MSPRRNVFAIVSVVLLTACGSPQHKGERAETLDAPSSGAALLYSCGDAAFEPEKLEGPGDLERSDSSLGEALRRLLKSPEGEYMKGDGWRILHEAGDETLVAAPTGRKEHPFVSATFRRSGSGWEAAGWGDCLPMAVVGERSAALWKLQDPIDPDATEVRIRVQERACSSGRKLRTEEIQTEVDYADSSISILATADPLPQGAHDCVGNPTTTITVELDEPIGDREVLDVGSYPPS